MMDNGGGTGSSGVDRNADKKQQQQAAAAKDALMAWLMGEFTAANAIIDALCHHLRWICISSNMNSLFSFNPTSSTSSSALNSSSSGGGMGNYEQVFAAIHRRRMNWIPVIKTQKYFPVAEVVAALRNVEQRSRSMPDLTDITTAAAVAAAAAAVAVEKKRKKNHSNRKKRVMVDSMNINGSGLLSDEAAKEPVWLSSLPEEEVIVKHEIQIEPPADDDDHEVTDHQEEITNIEYQKLEENAAAEEQAPKSRLGEDDVSSISVTETLSPSAVESSCLAQTKGDDWVISLSDGSNKCAETFKVTKDLETKKEINRHMVSIIEGVNLYENFLTDMELSKLVHFSDELRQSGQKGELPGETYIRFNEQKGNRREMIQLGVPIFRQRFNKPSNAEPIPDLLVPIIERLIQRDLMPESRKPNCCVINFFDEGEFSQPYVRPPHIDQPMSTISLITDCNVVFGDFSTKKCQVHSDGSLELTLEKG